MEGDGNDVNVVRVSERTTKGVPPLRYRREETCPPKVPSPKSTSSKASSARRRSQAEAERDMKIANLKKQYAEKIKPSRILEIQINATQSNLDKATERFRKTPNSENENIYDKLQQELDQLKNDKALVDVELELFEMSHQEEIQALKSTCQAELDQIEEDDVLSDHDIIEDINKNTDTWVGKQVTFVDEAAGVDILEESGADHGAEIDEVQEMENAVQHHNEVINANVKSPNTSNVKQPAHQYGTPKTHYTRPPPFQPEIRHRRKEDQLIPPQTYQRHRKKYHVPAYLQSSSDEEMGATGSQHRHQSNEVTMHDLVNALNNFGSNSPRSEIVMKTVIDKDLPKFGGEPEQWIQFKSEFDRTTKKLKIDDSENMIRLRKSLVGQAKTTVQHLMVNVSNVSVIIESLEKRFGRPRVVLNKLAEKAKACGNVTIAKPDSIIEFGLAIQALVANVKSFKADGYLHSTELLDALVKKLSPDLATRWYEWLSADMNRADNLIGFSEWTAIQLDIAYQRADCKLDDVREERGDHRRRRGLGAVNIISTDNANCAFCKKGNHALDKCWAFQKKTLDDRWNFVKSNKLCICCLKPGHRARECQTGGKCDAMGCNSNHHRLLHSDKKSAQEDDKKRNKPPAFFDEDEKSSVKLLGNFAVITGCDGPLPIVPVKLFGPNGTVKCHALLDTGASRSLIKMSIAKKIGLQGTPIEYSYKGITGETKTEMNAQLVSCDVAGTLRGSSYNKLRSAITVEDIKMNPFTMNVEEIKRKWPHLKQVAATNLLQVVPDVVIGNNNPRLILARKLVLGADDEPVGWRSELGWAISGNFDNERTGIINVMSGGGVSNDELHALIKQSFSLEDFGVKPAATKGKNLDEKRAYQILESTTRKVRDRWEVGLLWREDNVQFPESEFAARKRLQFMERKMENPAYKKLYGGKMQEYLTKGYMKKLTADEAALKRPATYTIPHFGVTNPNKPGKFRLVLDAKAKTHGVSLNDKLLKGPDLIRSLVGVLWSFRKHRIALTGDISDMFHRVMIREEDRDSQRILWRETPTAPIDTYQMQVMIFGATSSPSSAIYVKNQNARQFMEKYPSAANAVIDHFYVDDCLTGGKDEDEVIELRKQLYEINDAGNFHLCKFMSNSVAVMESIPEDLRAESTKNFEDKSDLPGERVLGMWWNSHDDAFQFKLGLHKVKSKILGGDIPTKREMCGLIMSLFDPLGLICHYKVKALILLQEVWSSGTSWDDEIPFSTFIKWRKWLARLEEVKEVKLPRCYSPFLSCAEDIQLHIFVDASSEAYCSISYLRISCKDKVEVAFVGARARIAPLKKSTIPRLELQAALMGTRLASSIQHEVNLKINRRYFWSDSSTVLQWLCSRAGNLKEFVANRIGEIQETSNQAEWNWVPTKLNIADVATRFESEIGFSPDNDWYTGPQFLQNHPETWNFEEERKRIKNEGTIAILVSAEQCTENTPTMNCSISEVVPDPSRFSSFCRLVRASAAVREAANHWLRHIRKEDTRPPWSLLPIDRKDTKGSTKVSSNLSAASIMEAESQLIKLAQWQSFGNEMEKARDGGQLKRNGRLWRLCPFVDQDGLLRVDGRIDAAIGAPEGMKNPIILPPRHHITELIVDAEHVSCAHQGVETVLNNLRKRFWILDARHTVKRSWIRCGVCRLARTKPLNPKMGSLPDFRLASNQPAFTFVGIDLFGPMQVTVGRRHEKRWGVLICCMVTRAVHLEIVHSLATDEILMALSRFIDVRGRPAHIHSDNGTNFVGAAKELREQWKQVDFAQIQQHGKFHKIKWTFNPPAAPHMGGAWERLIQIVKKCLHVTLKEVNPKDTTLLTVFKSVENIVNSRPLTFVSSDPHDPVPISPNDILRGGCDTGPSLPVVIDTSENCLRAKWKRSQILADQFWRRWTSDYLPKLVRREKWQEPTEPMDVGDLVFLVDDNLPRNCWVRGVVSQVFPAKDGQVRQVEVTTKWKCSGKKDNKLRRPVAKLCPLGLWMEIKGSHDP